ncbi:hypothetical protein P7C70_g5059, partial [Phenoliferia sp. Uapishka_3]
MPTYAILGATGQTGSELVKLLLPTSAHLNVYARNAARLEEKHPGLSAASNVTTFIGDLSNTVLLASCLADADVVLSTVAQNQNEPGCSIAQRTAQAIIEALEGRQDKCPTVVFLASFSVDPNNVKNQAFGARCLHNVLHHVYTDLEKSIVLLQSHPWIPLVVAAPGGLVHHDSTYTVELTSDTALASPLTGYADLARGMIDMGDAGYKWKGEYVGMILNGGKAIEGNPLSLMRYLLPNMLAMVCPPLWRAGRNYWPV